MSNHKPPPGTLIRPDHPLAKEIAVHYPLNAGQGLIIYDHAPITDWENRIHGVINGATWGGGGLFFDPSNSENVSFGANKIGPLLNGATNISFSVTMAPDGNFAGGGFKQAFGYHIAGAFVGGNLRIDDVGGGQYKFRVGFRSENGDAFRSLQETNARPYGIEHNVIGKADLLNKTISLLVDGVEDPASPAVANFSSNFYIQNTPTPTDFFMGLAPNFVGGRFSDCGIWTRGLSEPESRELHNNRFDMYQGESDQESISAAFVPTAAEIIAMNKFIGLNPIQTYGIGTN